MGVHTGDSITVAPAQTLTDKEYQYIAEANKIKEKIKQKKLNLVEDNIPLWIEKEHDDLDFSVNTVLNERNNYKLKSMPNKFINSNNYIKEISDNISKINESKNSLDQGI